MNFHVSRRYSDLPSVVITRGCAEKDLRKARRGRVAGKVSTGTSSTGERFARAGARGGRARFILLNVKFHVGTQL